MSDATMTEAERERLLARLTFMLHGPGRPAQHASDAVRSKWRLEISTLRERLRWDVDDIDIYRAGLVALSVCYPREMSLEHLTRLVNDKSGPTGLDHEWSAANDETFSGGEPNPSVCNHDATRSHRLFSC